MTPEVQNLLRETEKHMQQSVAHYDELFGKIRAGKASPALLDPIRVDYYGAPTPLKHIATIAVADSRTLLIQPFEPKMAKAIEKAIAEANLGLQSATDGAQVRVAFPPLTEERRKLLVKQVRDIAEEGRVAVRNIRRDALEALRKLGKQGTPEDVIRKAQEELQKLTERYIAQIARLAEAKESELMTV